MAARLFLVTATALGAAACHGSGTRGPCSDVGPIATVCGFRNPEDLEYVRSAGLLLVSNMRHDTRSADGGFLSAMVVRDEQVVRLWPADAPEQAGSGADALLGSDDCPGPPDPRAFYPHGLTARQSDARTLVYVAAHRGAAGGREAIEIFELSGRGYAAELAWKACIPTADGIQVNDLVVTTEGEVVVSDYQPDGSPWHMVAASLLGRDTGSVQVWSREHGWRTVERTQGKLPNGIAVSPRTRMLFYTETLAGTLHRRPLDQDAGAVTIELPGNPDNLSWTSTGTLLVATHTGGPRFLWCSLLGQRPCRTPWSVYEIDPDTMATRLVVAGDGEVIGAVATAVEADGRLYLSSVFDDRIGIAPLH